MSIGMRVRLARKKAGLTQSELAVIVGIAQPTLSELERGESSSTVHLVGIAKACNVNAEWLSNGNGTVEQEYDESAPDNSKYKVVPIRGMAKMGRGGYYDELNESDLGFVEIQTSDPNAFALKAVGDSMSPAIKNGVIVVCNTQWTAKKGDDVAICKTNYEKLIKEFISDQDGVVELKSVNGDEILRIPRKDILTMYVVSHKCHPNNIREL